MSKMPAMPTSDERGVSTISYAILLPLFLMLLFGGFYVWKVISLQQGLNRATYLAARELSRRTVAHGNDTPSVHELVLRYLRSDGFLFSEFSRNNWTWRDEYLRVGVSGPDLARSGYIEQEGNVSIMFRVRAELDVPWSIKLPFLPARRLTLSATHVGSYVHQNYNRFGKKPDVDPEQESWHVSPWPNPTRTTSQPADLTK